MRPRLEPLDRDSCVDVPNRAVRIDLQVEILHFIANLVLDNEVGFVFDPQERLHTDVCGLWLVYVAIDASARARAAGAVTYAESFLRTPGRVART